MGQTEEIDDDMVCYGAISWSESLGHWVNEKPPSKLELARARDHGAMSWSESLSRWVYAASPSDIQALRTLSFA